MNKQMNIDLVGRLAEHIDLNAAPEPVQPEQTNVLVDRAIDAAAFDMATAASPKPQASVSAKSIGLEWDRLYREGYLTSQNQTSLTAEEFRIIKRPLLRAAFNRDGAQRRLGHMTMVTSACPGDGKTFTSINLALSVATERDLHVLLIDCDIRRMGLSRALGLSERPGLMDLLVDPGVSFQEVAVRTSIPNLTIIPAGRPVDGSTEIFASQTMAKFAREVAGRYKDRFVILDTPPVLASSEAGVLAHLVGQVVVVVCAKRNGLERIGAIFVAAGNDDFCAGIALDDIAQNREAFGGSVGIGRQAEIEHDKRGVTTFHQRHRVGLIARDVDCEIARHRPLHLGLKARVVLDDQKIAHGFGVTVHMCRSRFHHHITQSWLAVLGRGRSPSTVLRRQVFVKEEAGRSCVFRRRCGSQHPACRPFL